MFKLKASENKKTKNTEITDDDSLYEQDDDDSDSSQGWTDRVGQKIIESLPVYSFFTGAAITLLFFPLIFLGLDLIDNRISFLRLAAGFISLTSIGAFLYLWNRNLKKAKFSSYLACITSVISAWPYLFDNPFAAFTVIAAVILIFYSVSSYQTAQEVSRREFNKRYREYVTGGLAGCFINLCVVWFICGIESDLSLYICAFSGLVGQFLMFRWTRKYASRLPKTASLGGFFLLLVSFAGEAWLILLSLILVFFIDIVLLNSFGHLKIQEEMTIYFFLYRPARMMFATFVFLCGIGSILLYLPISTKHGVDFIDSAFMAVSACCVTGLAVVDVSSEFTLCGRIFLIILVQLGALGIMSVASLAMQAMGRRLSIRHERILASITETDQEQNMLQSLLVILYYVFSIEAIGAVVLTLLYMSHGNPVLDSIGKGVFTSISAFCNSGFALNSDSLVSYQKSWGVLYTVAGLVFFGSMAPSTFIALLDWHKKRFISVAAYLALVGNFAALAIGTLSVAVTEWNGSLANLSVVHKISNSFFTSVALRTAGFNSINMDDLGSVTIIILIFLMLVGGAPGSVAGGVKTVTVAVLCLVFWSDICSRKKIIFRNRVISEDTVHRAIATVMGFGALLVFGWIMLVSTQNIAVRKLLFEAASAVGTVGISMGITADLDQIGKLVLMFLMFCGRIGPITLFSVMADDVAKNSSIGYPEEKISLT